MPGRWRTDLCCASVALCILASAGVPTKSSAQTADATGKASATVIEPMRAELIADLSFGYVATKTSSNGTVSIDALTGAVVSQNVDRTGCSKESCMPHPALFAVYGEAEANFRVETAETLIAVHSEDESATLSVSEIHSAVAGSIVPGSGTIGRDGTTEVIIGGTLQVRSGQKRGVYTAKPLITLVYE